MISQIVEEIGGDYVDSLCLIQGDLNPHTYQLVKGDDEKLTFADVVFYNGLGLEHGSSLAYHLSTNLNAISLGDTIAKQNPDLILHYNGAIDPHIWMDISLFSNIVPIVVETFAKKDPAHATVFRENGKRVVAAMHAAHSHIRDEFAKLPEQRRYLITSHDAFNYFTKAYLATDEERKSGTWQKRFEAPEGLAPDSGLSTADIQAVIRFAKMHGVHVVFPETNVSRDSIKKIIAAGQESGLDLKMAKEPLYGDAMGPKGSPGDTYLKMVIYNAKTIIENLK